MAIELIWSKRAEKVFDEIITYLENNWSDREVNNFFTEVQHFFKLL